MSLGAEADRREAEILRDRFGIAHVYAYTDEALFYGAGYATAEDRLFQMTMMRRVAQGRVERRAVDGAAGAD